MELPTDLSASHRLSGFLPKSDARVGILDGKPETSPQLGSNKSELINLLLLFIGCFFFLSTKVTANICNALLKEYVKYFL